MAISVETPRFQMRDLRVYPGYRQAGLAWLEYLTGIGAVYFVVGPLLGGMLPDVGWSLTVVSIALLIRGLVGIVAAPATALLIHRYGVRPVVFIGGILTAGFTILTGTVTNPVEFALVFGVALSFADSAMGNIPAATVVQKWFMSRRAVVMGFVNSGAGFGGFIFAPLMALLVSQLGWRHACFALGGIVFVLTIPALFMRTSPEGTGFGLDGVPGRVIPSEGHTDVIGTPQQGVGDILRHRVFWMLFLLFGIEAWSLAVFAADQVVYLKTIGIEAVESSAALGSAAGVAALSGILLSRLSDWLSPYYMLIASMASMFLGALVLLFAQGSALVWVYSILFGAGYGLFVPTIPVAISRYFGARDFTRAMGFGQILVAVLGGLGPFVTAVLVEHTGSFRLPILLIVALLALGVVVAALARPPRYALLTVKPVEIDVEVVPDRVGAQGQGASLSERH